MTTRRGFVVFAGASTALLCSEVATANDFCKNSKSRIGDADYDGHLKANAVRVNPKVRGLPESIEDIHREFQGLIERNIANLRPDAARKLFSDMSHSEVRMLAKVYNADSLNSGHVRLLLDYLVEKLDESGIEKLCFAFGFEDVYSRVLQRAPKHAEAAIRTLHTTAISGTSRHIQSDAGGTFENPLNYTLTEIYLSYRTAPFGSYSVAAAMYETAVFAGTRLSSSFFAGYALGSGIQKTWEQVSPDTWSSFSNFIGTSANSFVASTRTIIGSLSWNNISNAMSIRVGTLEESLWQSFMAPGQKSWFTIRGGDFGSTDAWQDKYYDLQCK